MGWIDAETSADFTRARRQAILSGLLDLVRRRPNELLSFDEVRQRLNVRGQRYLGIRVVKVDQIIGSEGRYADFDRHFLPRNENNRSRWRKIDSAMKRFEHLPPVDLYKLGDVYFVKDGNHRVSVARQQGQPEVDAYVTELIVDVPLEPDMDTHDLMLKEEYSDFLEWTGLHLLRPQERIEFSELGGYLDLVRDINGHRYFLGLEHSREIGRDEAVISWYDNVYTPIVYVIREQRLLELFPQRTEADLYRWILDHRWYLQKTEGHDPGASVAAQHYVAEYGKKSLGSLMEGLLKGAWSAVSAIRRGGEEHT